jgi:precorrin-6A/cobalt-precorrin-6A reductase
MSPFSIAAARCSLMSVRDRRLSLLILGGTGEAAALAAAAIACFDRDLAVTTSLAGRTAEPRPVPGRLRIGGFGGSAGLAAYLAEESVDLLIDATHPHATQISRQAHDACEELFIPRLVLLRPPWPRHAQDRWIEVEDAAAAAAALPALGRRVFLTIGTRGIPAFAALRDIHFIVRLVDPPRQPLPLASHEILIARGPFALAEEKRIFEHYAIDVLVAKASGGSATEAKLIAARECGLPVLMLCRPQPPPGPYAESVAAALDWVGARLAESSVDRIGKPK